MRRLILLLNKRKLFITEGVTFSVLIDLPNFDNTWCDAIDPMHNIFLGLAEHVINTWKEIGILQLSHLAKLQEKVDLIVPPPR